MAEEQAIPDTLLREAEALAREWADVELFYDAIPAFARALMSAELRGREQQKEANPLPPEIQSMVDGGWKFAWEPETMFIGAYHPSGGKQSVLQIEYPKFHCLGEFIATAIRQ